MLVLAILSTRKLLAQLNIFKYELNKNLWQVSCLYETLLPYQKFGDSRLKDPVDSTWNESLKNLVDL